ncbi:cysteine hydrolase family protein [Pseudomonas sp. L13]|uniref:cysteine hydrolase family protein n=1 Tax=Pseudomonas sp. L13 TaxID=343985 RepID=UPI00137A616F|nr:cysteine hydrolase [Pseudomonas sp. L13]NCE89432.1 cysteine hydrolase [Pseudomonas sp. L13]
MTVRTAVLALHYQNEVLHPKGRIRVGLAENDPMRGQVIEAAGRLLAGARERELPILHVRIAFRPDYADCPSNTPIFRRTVELGAVRNGEWGAEFMAALAPQPSEREFVMTHTRISAFKGTAVEQTLRMLGVQHLIVAGVATHSVVENTVREAADLGYAITVAADACAAAAPQVHQAALSAMALIADISTVAGALQAE